MDRAGLPEHLYIKQEVEDILPSDSQEHFVSTSPSLSSRQGDNILATPDASVKLEHNSDPLHLESSASSNTDLKITSLALNKSHQEYGLPQTTENQSIVVKEETVIYYEAGLEVKTYPFDENAMGDSCTQEEEIIPLMQCSVDMNPEEIEISISLSEQVPQPLPEKPYKCELCGKGFTQNNYLKSHMKFHTKEKQFQCEICKNFFSRKSNLTTHLRTHTGEKPYVCEICGKRFSQTHNLTIHMRVHTGEKPFKCEVCEKNFKKMQSLTIHMRSHTGEKPFKCEICMKEFIHMQSLIIHMRTHTGEKPFECSLCKRRFSQKQHLSLHVKHYCDGQP
ncbi:zinc finger protein ZFP2-like isoform X2 [Artemia franciscana]|uniref:zinc finger protein ZFP2-like isoform X2 n=1 Tax=Artemia franciscana TaxID=6661 RepID=UPI0032DBDBDC